MTCGECKKWCKLDGEIGMCKATGIPCQYDSGKICTISEKREPEKPKFIAGDVYREEGYPKSCNVVIGDGVGAIPIDYIERHENDGVKRIKLFNLLDFAKCFCNGGVMVAISNAACMDFIENQENDSLMEEIAPVIRRALEART